MISVFSEKKIMAKLPLNFNWKESATHMELLNVFSKPHDVNHILTWQTIRQTLGESTEDAIERFVRNDVLIPATLEESLLAVFQVSELKKLLKELNIKQSGNKSELAEKLVTVDRIGVEKLLKKHRVMKCSESALMMLSGCKSMQTQELEFAQGDLLSFLKMVNLKMLTRVTPNTTGNIQPFLIKVVLMQYMNFNSF